MAEVQIAGRNRELGEKFARTINADFVSCNLHEKDSIQRVIDNAHIVVHTAGPFQNTDYYVAEQCIEAGSHYLDLSDGRQFVEGISRLDESARQRRVFVTSGASSVPAITFALIQQLSAEFLHFDQITIGLSPGNQNPRGTSTIAAILTYLGMPISVFQKGQWICVSGWGDGHYRVFPAPVGSRRVYNCDVPDLTLFPKLWKAGTVRFYAGLELDVFNFALSGMASLRKLFGIKPLSLCAPLFLKLSLMLYSFGSKNGSLAVWISGKNHQSRSIKRMIAIVTRDDGPATPSSPAIVLTKKILEDGPPAFGAFPCVGFLALDDLLDYLRPFGIWCVMGDEHGWKEC